ncbi:hypothetical protein V6N11_028128 [Hibiscus sabdariffa]|uniref:ATP-dependent RNA helicase n=1 Tax=Hibiscus sabdariffa TaxID=183260 RepID=A0ABR2P0F5_9ROSI
MAATATTSRVARRMGAEDEKLVFEGRNRAQRAVMPIINGRDVIAQAQSGTGKTSMIALTVCQVVDTASREVQALILSPTRELASQTEKVIRDNWTPGRVCDMIKRRTLRIFHQSFRFV